MEELEKDEQMLTEMDSLAAGSPSSSLHLPDDFAQWLKSRNTDLFRHTSFASSWKELGENLCLDEGVEAGEDEAESS